MRRSGRFKLEFSLSSGNAFISNTRTVRIFSGLDAGLSARRGGFVGYKYVIVNNFAADAAGICRERKLGMLENSHSVRELWEKIARVLQGSLHDSTYDHWFKPVVPVEVSDQTLTLGVSDDFFADSIGRASCRERVLVVV